MPLQETIDTFSHFISEADKLGLSYFCLMRYSPMLDVEFDGKPRKLGLPLVFQFKLIRPSL